MDATRGRLAAALSHPPQAVAFAALVLVVSAPSATLLQSAAAAPAKSVELTERRTETSKTFKNPDGTFTTSIYSGAVHFRDAEDRWLEISNELVPTAAPEYAFENRANRFHALFKGDSEAGFVRLDTEGETFTVALDGAERRPVQVDKSRASYGGVFPGVVLDYDVVADGVKETLVLSNADVPTRYRFVLTPPSGIDWRAQRVADGSWDFAADGSGRPVITLAAPIVGEAGERMRPGRADLAVRKADDHFLVDLTIDGDWLGRTDRRFPVSVDPTITIARAQKEANWDITAGSYFGDVHMIGADEWGTVRSTFQFNLSSVPAGADVNAATMGLFYGGACLLVDGDVNCGQPGTWDVHRMTAAWNASGSTSQLHWGSALSSFTFGASAPSQWMSWNVTQTVKDWLAGQANYGFLVKRNPDTLGVGGILVEDSSSPSFAPKIDVTYNQAVSLDAPVTVHSNGAELTWSRWDTTLGAFTSYEVHRSTSASFTPSSSTLLATIRDVSVTNYRDTTAAPNGSFTYKVVMGTNVSNGQIVALPAAGLAQKTLQPGPGALAAGFLEKIEGYSSCANAGSNDTLRVGANATDTYRSLLAFQLGDIPPGSAINSATLSLYLKTAPSTATNIAVHRLTSGWDEGTGWWHCVGTGATWWDERPDVRWAAPGGDFAGTAVSTRSQSPSDAAGWYGFDLKSAVQSWTSGQAPNFGVLLKDATEPRTGDTIATYVSDDEMISPTLRPKLAITYQDGSQASGPTASISSPADWSAVRGTVNIEAAATDDRRVDKIEFLVDGLVAGSDTTPPFTFAWNSAAAVDGQHKLKLTATDDAGNTGTSAEITVVSENSAAPTTSVTSVATSYPSAVRADQPAGYWRLGDAAGVTTAADASGNGNQGTYQWADLGVDDALASDSDTAVRLNAPAPAPAVPANDAFADAQQLLGGTGRTVGSNVGASKQTGEPNHGGNAGGKSVWYRWTAPASASVTIETPVSSFDTLLGVYRGTAVNALTLVAQNDNVSGSILTSKVTFTATAGLEYKIAVDGKSGASGSVNLRWTQTGTKPANDAFASALAISGASGKANGTNTNATKETGEPNHAGNAGGKSVWYSWTAPATGAATIDTIGSSFNTLLGVYTGSAVNALTTVASDNDSGGNLTSKVTFSAVAGTVYRIAVDGSAGAAGDINLNWSVAVAGLIDFGDRFDSTGTAAFSLEAWVKPTTVDATARRIFWKGNASQGYSLSLSTAGLTFARTRDGASDSVTAAALAANAWSHVVATYDGATMTLYVNGAQAASAGGKIRQLLDVTESLRIGADNAGAGLFAGSVDEAAVYPVALTAARVTAHRGAGMAAASTTVRGSVTVNASASDDKAVTKVEFYVDDIRFDEDTSAPYAGTLNTLDPDLTVYDGARVLTTKAYDAGGQVTTSAVYNVTVDNAGQTKFHADISSTPVPQDVVYDPAAQSQQQYGVDVTVKNTSTIGWATGEVKLRYRWLSPDPTAATREIIEGTDVAVPALAAGAPTVTPIRVTVTPPALPAGVNRATYTLQLELFDAASGASFGSKGNKPLDNPVIVDKALVRGALGLERYYHYVGAELGAGMQNLVNVANGNSIVRWTPFGAPGTGLATVVDLTYNALEKTCACPAGNNWSLAISSLTRLGEPLHIHPQQADTLAGRPAKHIDFVDADGTMHDFVWHEAQGRYLPPAGVHLYLRQINTPPNARTWAITRPDRVTFYFDEDGFPTAVDDRNGNTLTFTLETTPPAEDPGGPKKRVTKVTDQGGRDFTIAYYSKAEAKKPQIRGKVKEIRDHTGSTLRFDYYEDGNLRRLIQVGGTRPETGNGSSLADRVFTFTYTTSAGNGPAIPNAADRTRPEGPEPRTSPQSTRLYSVIDPLVRETTFSYLGSGYGEDRWKLASRTDRASRLTSFAYDTVARRTTVTAPLARVSKYDYDVEGKVTTIANPLDQQVGLEWTNRHVAKITEPTGKFTSYVYDPNGYLASVTDELGNKSELRYRYQKVGSATDVSDAWSFDRTNLLASKTDPKGTKTNDPADPADDHDYEWTFTYDGKANLTDAADPLGNTTKYAYNADGTLASKTDPKGVATPAVTDDYTSFFRSYDANGFPQEIEDASGNITKLAYDADGLLRGIQAPRRSGLSGGDPTTYQTRFEYDAFHRLGRQSTPKGFGNINVPESEKLIWSGAEYDANDNILREYAPAYGAAFMQGTPTEHTYDVMDRQTQVVVHHDRSTATADANTKRTTLFAYDDAGRLTRITAPRGVASTTNPDDFVTDLVYDKLDRLVSRVRLDGAGTALREHSCYDLAGDQRWLVSPKAGLTAAPSNCGVTGVTVPDFTTALEYDAAHRLLKETAPLRSDTAEPLTRQYDYNENDELIGLTNEEGAKEIRSYDQRGLLEKIEQPFRAAAQGVTAKSVTSVFSYDANGDLETLVSPRAYDVAAGATPDKYVTRYRYDEDRRLLKIELPRASTADATYAYRHYDADGNLDWTSRPVRNTDESGVPENQKTKLSYFDTGWIETKKDPGLPKVRFDYTAEGWQRTRVPLDADDPATANINEEQPVEGRRITWDYYANGLLKTVSGANQQTATYSYDLDDNLAKAVDGFGKSTADQRTVEARMLYDGFDRLVRVRENKRDPSEASDLWSFTAYRYDANDNLEFREEEGRDRLVSDAPETWTNDVKRGRQHDFTYDRADWLVDQTDHGTDNTGCGDDRKIEFGWTKLGQQSLRRISKSSSSCTPRTWTPTQEASWTYFRNGLLDTLTTKSDQNQNGVLDTSEVVESHTVKYTETENAAEVFVNGNRTSDTFKRTGPQGETVPCSSATCTETYSYDARDRLTALDDGRDSLKVYELTPAADLDAEKVYRGGNRSQRLDADLAEHRDYRYTDSDGDLQEEPPLKAIAYLKGPLQGETHQYLYDVWGNLRCVVKGDTAPSTCPATGTDVPADQTLVASYSYDELNRLSGFAGFGLLNTGSTQREKLDSAEYRYDALDRPEKEGEFHKRWDTPTQTAKTETRLKVFNYLGLADAVSSEQHYRGDGNGSVSATPATLLRDKAYGYDAYGIRVSYDYRKDVDGDPATADGQRRQYAYGYDVHGSVSLLLDEAGQTKASYGYKPYGQPDDDLTRESDPDTGQAAADWDPFNAYRYTGKRLDPGSSTLDMGARRFGPAVGQFLQADQYDDALGDLSLSLDPLTQNRYGLAGGNPLSFVETDGHNVIAEAGTAPRPISKGTDTRNSRTGSSRGTGAAVASWIRSAGKVTRSFDREFAAGAKETLRTKVREFPKLFQFCPVWQFERWKGCVSEAAHDQAESFAALKDTGIAAAHGDPRAIGSLSVIIPEVLLLKKAGAVGRSSAAEGGTEAILREHVAAAIERYDVEGMTQRQALRAAQSPRLEPAFRGERIDTFAKESAAADPRLSGIRITGRFQPGPDFVDSVSGAWWDITTPAQWAAHEARYGPGGTLLPH